LLLFLAEFAYLLTSTSLTPHAINALEDIIFGIVFLVAAIAARPPMVLRSPPIVPCRKVYLQPIIPR
jgi:hypothetical protein